MPNWKEITDSGRLFWVRSDGALVKRDDPDPKYPLSGLRWFGGAPGDPSNRIRMAYETLEAAMADVDLMWPLKIKLEEV